MTDTVTHPSSPSTSSNTTNSPETSRLLDLSLTQLVAGSMAAATAAALGSRIGVVGTITGAALGSVVSAVAASLYIGSLHRARAALRRSAPTSNQAASRDNRLAVRRVLATSAVVFAIAAAFLTGLQLASGANVTGTSVGARGRGTTQTNERSAQQNEPQTAATGTPAPTTSVPTTAPTESGAPTTGTTETGAPTSSAPSAEPSSAPTAPTTATPDPSAPTAPAPSVTP